MDLIGMVVSSRERGGGKIAGSGVVFLARLIRWAVDLIVASRPAQIVIVGGVG